MRIAVIGGRGFIGGEFVEYATKKGHETIIIGSELDAFSEMGQMLIAEKIKTCDSIVFLAAKRPIKTFAMNEYNYNVCLAEKYLSLANDLQIRNIVITSSRSVYSNDNIPWKESEFQTPLSLYGASKQAVDTIALLYNEKFGLKIKCLRLAQVIGTGEKEGFLINTILNNAIAGRPQTVYGKGIGKRQYIYVKDVCDAILHCLVSCSEEFGIYNIGMPNSISIADMVKTVNEVYENTSETIFAEDKPEDTKHYLMDVSKTESILGWKPGFDIRAAFVDMKENV